MSTYQVSWSTEDGQYVATCSEFPSLSHLADGPLGALRGLQRLVADVVAEGDTIYPTRRQLRGT